MSIEIGNIACRDNNTEFQAFTEDGRKVMFLIPNEVILDFLGETEGVVDCPQFVLETTEIFEELAEDYIARGIEQEPVIIDFQTISHYFSWSMRRKPSLLQVLYDISREDVFLKKPVPEEIIELLRVRQLITTRMGEGPKLTDLGRAALKKAGLED